ncbi:MAG: PKD domain-containing protein, partial [Promethearchaeota archaeon]
MWYSWDFGDGSTSILQNPSHGYDTAGNYTVTLTVTDNDGDFASYTSTITVVDDIEPNALFAVSNSTVNVDEVVLFTDTSTGGNPPLSYSWDFGDGSTSILQ